MSRIGNQPITLPESVTATITGQQVVIKGPKGEMSQTLTGRVKVELKDKELIVSLPEGAGKDKALHGLYRSLLNNMVLGVSEGFTKTLEIQGTGYRVTANGENLDLALGFSHPVSFSPPAGIKLEIKDQKFIVVTGIDKHLVGQTAANIRALRSPDAYKGKGIRYEGEIIKLKPGKAAKAAEA